MALSSNESVDLFAQRRLQALDKARDTARSRAADSGAQHFALETQAAARSDRQRSEAARTAASDRTADKDPAPKPAAVSRPAAKAVARPEPTAKPATAPDRRAAAKPARDTQAAATDDAKPAAKPAAETTAVQAAQSGEAQATLATLGGVADDADETDEESAAATDAAEADPSALLLAAPLANPATSAKAAVSGDAAAAIRGGASGAKSGTPVEGVGQAGGDGDPDAETAATGFAALTDAGATPTAVDPGVLRTSAPAATQHTTAAAPVQPSTPPVPIGQVPLTIGLRSLSGSSQFEIRLDPLELGRIDVTLDIDKDRGTVATRIVVDRPETLALLQRDAGQLQQALGQAGLDAGAGGIDLSLRGENANGGADTGQRDGQSRGPRQPASGTQDVTNTLDAGPLRALRSIGSLDIRI